MFSVPLMLRATDKWSNDCVCSASFPSSQSVGSQVRVLHYTKPSLGSENRLSGLLYSYSVSLISILLLQHIFSELAAVGTAQCLTVSHCEGVHLSIHTQVVRPVPPVAISMTCCVNSLPLPPSRQDCCQVCDHRTSQFPPEEELLSFLPSWCFSRWAGFSSSPLTLRHSRELFPSCMNFGCSP